jgi:hypothetical protein
LDAISSHLRIKNMNKDELEKLLDRGQGKDPNKATDLRGKALLRATEEKIPRTMTPYEWLEYYEKHGIPPEHQTIEAKPSLLKRIRAKLKILN